MNRSASEWALEQFLEEFLPSPSLSPSFSPPPKIFNTASISSAASSSGASQSSTSKREEGDDEVVEVKRADRGREGSLPPSLPPLDPKLMSGNKSDQYHNFLKSQLNLACAAVALTRAVSSKPGNLAQRSDCKEKQSKLSQSGSNAHEEGISLGLSKRQTEPVSTPTGIPALPAIPKNSVVQVGQTTSGSSRDESDEEEIEGDLENTDPSYAKRARRMLSNRESARRSRRRKQAHMTELETQVGQLRVEYSGFLKRLTDMNQKYDDASVDNRILKANIETLRAKVKMAEETVKRVTGINPFIVAMANGGPSTAMPFVSSQLTNDGLPIHPNTHFFHHTADPSFLSTIPNNHQRLDENLSNSLVGVPQLDTVPDNVSKQIHRHSGSGSGGLH